MSTFIMSDKYPDFLSAIEDLGHNVIKSDTIKTFHLPEQKHADMQILQINSDIFILNECTILKEKLKNKSLHLCSKNAGKKYPKNILLNFLYLNNTLYGKISAIDNNLLDYCNLNNIDTVNVNQGYSRCSVLVVDNNAVITSDISLKKVLENNGVDVLLISSGNIKLEGFDYGFIGGASGKIDNDTIVFFGNVKNHSDYKNIEEFCIRYKKKIKILCEYLPLTDIGGIVKIGE